MQVLADRRRLCDPSTARDLSALQSLIDGIESRVSSRAARELVDDLSSYKDLPYRFERLVKTLHLWSADPGSPDLPYYNVDEDPVRARLSAVTASVLAQASSNFFYQTTILFTYWIRNSVNPIIKRNHHENRVTKVKWSRLATWLHQLQWLRQPNGLLIPYFQAALRQAITMHVRRLIKGNYNTDFFDDLSTWLDALQLWVNQITIGSQKEAEDCERQQQQDEDGRSHSLLNLSGVLDRCYCQVRFEEIFELVAEYPDSHAAIVELRSVLHRAHMRTQFAEELRAQLVKRLNHPGANTSQIIDVYISVYKVLAVIDPTTRSVMARSPASNSTSTRFNNPILLSLVAEPVRTYLRSRKDTVRSIISSLTDATIGGDLYKELRRQDTKPLESMVIDSDDEEECPTMDWQPPPPLCSCPQLDSSFTEATHTFTTGNAPELDILAMLVSIYGSKELFVDEYRTMLADKLLIRDSTNSDSSSMDTAYNTDHAVHTLELLKLRFGESSMRNCEVMIKDMDDSKRTNANIHSKLGNATRVDAAMISHIFWPPLMTDDNLKHHPRLQSHLDAFASEYARLRNPRKLVWMKQHGFVTLELMCVDAMTKSDSLIMMKPREFTVSPLLATVISHFEDKRLWILDDLSNETSVPSHVLRKKIAYWVHQHVLVQTHLSGGSTQYQLATPDHFYIDRAVSITGPSASKNNHLIEEKISPMLDERYNLHLSFDEDFDGLGAVSVSAQEKAEMEVYESYIVGMLTNAVNGLQMLRIHEMLQMFVSGSETTKYNKTPAQLSTFLQLLCQQEKLECGADGLYKLCKYPYHRSRYLVDET